MKFQADGVVENFYSHASCEARPEDCRVPASDQNISTHTPLARRDHAGFRESLTVSGFLLTRLLRGATEKRTGFKPAFFISTHTPLARRDVPSQQARSKLTTISTHTPLARRDISYRYRNLIKCISTHTPLARRDRNDLMIAFSGQIFLLTRLLRGATEEKAKVKSDPGFDFGFLFCRASQEACE